MSQANDYLELTNKIALLEQELQQLRLQLQPQYYKLLLPEQGKISLVSFQLADQPFAFYLPVILEIIRMVKLIPLAAAPPFVAGLLNLRGNIIPTIDLRLLIGLEKKPYGINTSIILVEYKNKTRAFIIDNIKEVVIADQEDLKEPDPIIPYIEFVLALVSTPLGLITLFDHSHLMLFDLDKYLISI